ncbi:chemotaxis protein CheW [Reinekea forsetii]|uniref:Chemotaxis protein CheW n=1 Tax=Reinekea forsetii TaxID=1336806 RepID=A0A2K8KQ85_9GAMM|nr:chemotaxis protein CheW [Reinekea forsetii]ATX76907.1 positive regulator of CheA protein activity (CheW) [Reinekea forsetii]
MTKIENGNSSHGNDVDEEFLSFVLGDESYALDIMSVKEIRGYETVTKIANAPAFVKGVLNLRGDIVPIVDLRMKFDIGQATYDEFTIVIMLSVNDRIVGVVVDAVSDVVKFSAQQILPPPEFGVSFNTRFLRGLATIENKMIVLVNIAALIGSDELGLMDLNTTAGQE